MGNRIRLHLAPNYDTSLVPMPAKKLRDWWEDNNRTKDHAKHCLPLSMANSLGYYIRSPGSFLVKWNGDTNSPAKITAIEKSSHYEVDAHAAFGSFAVQAKFVPITDDPGDFVYIKGIPNERGMPYTCMEACIEAWWNVGHFGLVYMINQPGEFMIHMGQPIAQMFLYHGAAGASDMEFVNGYPTEHNAWAAKRSRPGYQKDFDYMRGLKYNGDKVHSHITNWRDATKFRK